MAQHLPHTRLSLAIDGALVRLGHALSWVWLVLLLVIVGNVALRYLFREGRIEFEELQWHLYSLGFLFGLAYAVSLDDHIRVDVLYERCSLRHRAWVELYGLLLLYFPFLALLGVYSLPFVAESFAAGEVSPAPGGLPLRWLVKALLPLATLLLALAGVARLSRAWCCLFGTPRAIPGPAPWEQDDPGDTGRVAG